MSKNANSWLGLEVGQRVRCSDPENFRSDLARKLTKRVGTIERFQMFSGAPIVKFAAEGRRKELQWVPPRRDDIIVETDQ